MIKKISLALFFTLAACSDNSSSGTDANIDTGDEISIELPTGNSSEGSEKSSSSGKDISSSSDIDTLKVEKSSTESSAADAGSSSSVASDDKSSSSASKDESSSSEAVKDVSSSSIPAASSASSSASDNAFFNEGWREGCVAKINEYRATENLKPLAPASEEKQACADKQSADDLASNKAHGHFKDCGEYAQNSGLNFSTVWGKSASDVAERYLKMMWEDEKNLVTRGERDLEKEEDFPYIGHYKNMRSASYTTVACGIALSADGKKGWLNVNFY